MIQAVDRGASLVDETASALQSAVDAVKSGGAMAETIAARNMEQAEAISQVTQGVDQIASVVQTNSATAEESAAASDELNSQAQTLKFLIGRFQLKKEQPLLP